MQSCVPIAHIEFTASVTLRCEARDGDVVFSPRCLMYIKFRHCKHFAISELHIAHALSTDTPPIGTTAMDSSPVVWMFTCKVGRFTGVDGDEIPKSVNSV